ncbi:MAG: hypothetical protein ACKPER_10810, partial [Dolichospermum sp.]
IPETEPLAINRLPELKQNNEISGEPLNNPSPEQYDIGSRTTTGISPTQAVKTEDNVVKIPQEQEKIALADNSTGKSPAVVTTESEFKSQGTEQLVAKLQSHLAFRQNIQREYPNLKEKGVIRETIPTDTAEMVGTVSGAVLVGSDGKVLDIKFQETSISPQLQSQVRAYFKNNPPQADQQLISSYPFQFKFQNNLNASGVSSKTQPSTNTNSEKISTIQTQPSAIPNSEKISTIQTQSSTNTNSEKISTPPDTKNTLETATVNTINPVPSATQNDNSFIRTESHKKLIQKLRQIKEERKNPQ